MNNLIITRKEPLRLYRQYDPKLPPLFAGEAVLTDPQLSAEERKLRAQLVRRQLLEPHDADPEAVLARETERVLFDLLDYLADGKPVWRAGLATFYRPFRFLEQTWQLRPDPLGWQLYRNDNLHTSYAVRRDVTQTVLADLGIVVDPEKPHETHTTSQGDRASAAS